VAATALVALIASTSLACRVAGTNSRARYSTKTRATLFFAEVTSKASARIGRVEWVGGATARFAVEANTVARADLAAVVAAEAVVTQTCVAIGRNGAVKAAVSTGNAHVRISAI